MTIVPPSLNSSPTYLSPWLDGIAEADWHGIDPDRAVDTEWNFRGRVQGGVQRSKRLDLASAGKHLALLVGLKPAVDPNEMDIWVQIYPTTGSDRLPYNLQLSVLDEACETVMQAIARETKNIQLEFSGQLGERFSIRVALEDFSLTEAFVI